MYISLMNIFCNGTFHKICSEVKCWSVLYSVYFNKFYEIEVIFIAKCHLYFRDRRFWPNHLINLSKKLKWKHIHNLQETGQKIWPLEWNIHMWIYMSIVYSLLLLRCFFFFSLRHVFEMFILRVQRNESEPKEQEGWRQTFNLKVTEICLKEEKRNILNISKTDIKNK